MAKKKLAKKEKPTLTLLAIDPGTTQSAWVVYRAGKILSFGLEPNMTVLKRIYADESCADHFAIEMIESMGRVVGRETFETTFWVGRFVEAWRFVTGLRFTRIYRMDVKKHICDDHRAKDTNVRQALIDRFGLPGTKKAPGALYGIRKDLFSALAVAVTCDDTDGRAREIYRNKTT